MITARVREILLLKANGKQSKEIAYDLDLHIRTVETHIATAKKELEASEGDIDARSAPRPPTRIVRQFRREIV